MDWPGDAKDIRKYGRTLTMRTVSSSPSAAFRVSEFSSADGARGFPLSVNLEKILHIPFHPREIEERVDGAATLSDGKV